MILTYETFNDNIVKMIKIRSANYAETDCDVDTLIQTVYEDIQTSVLLDIKKQAYLTEGLSEFTIPSFDSDTVADITEKYTDVLDIVDEYDVSILDNIHETDDGTWQWNKARSGSSTYPNGDTIYFIRKKIVDIENLKPEIYGKIVTAMLEGVMYYIQTSIPNQVDGQVGNFSYQRYYNAKKALMDLQPQYRYRLKEEKQWL